MWLAYHDRLLTKVRLQKLHIYVDTDECCLCDTAEAETIQHLFVDCRSVSAVRNALSLWAGINILRKEARQKWKVEAGDNSRRKL